MKHLNKYLEFKNEDIYSVRDEIDDKVRPLTSYLKDVGVDVFITPNTDFGYRPALEYIIVGMKSEFGIEWNKIKNDVIQAFEYLSNDYELSAFIRVISIDKSKGYSNPGRFIKKNYEDFESLYNDNFILSRIEISILNRKYKQ
jgi:hypothetical protein